MNKSILTVLSILLVAISSLKADEGMWLPMHVKRLNHVDMKKQGLQLSADEIYNINKSSLKNAIVSLGGFCTAEMISKEGLMLTNHHCAFGAIQEHSKIDSDYLTDGFWAMSKDKELPASGAYAAFLVRMEDVSKTINAELNDGMSSQERNKVIKTLSDSLVKEATKDTHYNAKVKDFFHGNEFYLFVYETFNDVRLVGAPPSSIGKFGGDTDNWMWPRHTGDFSLLRVYCDKDGKPADYSPDNVPYTPKHHLPISLNGVEKGDYSMIMGYPGRTNRYLTSYGVNEALTLDQPARVKIRGKKLSIYKEFMDADPKVKIQYAAKYAQVSNYWKYFQGQQKGLKRLKVYDKKKAIEDELVAWIKKDVARTKKYGEAIKLIEESYTEAEKYVLLRTYLGEAVIGCEILKQANNFRGLNGVLANSDAPQDKIDLTVSGLKEKTESFFKDYNLETDKKVFAALMEMYTSDIAAEFHPEALTALNKKYKGNYTKMAEDLFKKSILADKAKTDAFLASPSSKVLDKDPAFQLLMSFFSKYFGEIKPATAALEEKRDKGMRLFSAALREMNTDKKYYPDANSTMRLTYGNVLDYVPADAKFYKHYTTANGILEKEDATNPEFVVPEKLVDLIKKKQFGRYSKNGELPVCFITNTDITGGNSGSPVINGNGELIGCAFDGNWEAMSGDIAFEKDLQRTIAVDVRYILFIIEKYAGAKHLVDEMTLVRGPKPQAIVPVENAIKASPSLVPKTAPLAPAQKSSK